MKLIHYTLAIAVLSVLSCREKKENTVASEQQEQKTNQFIGEWVQVSGDNTIEFISQGDSILFHDGDKNFKAESTGDGSINVDLSSIFLGIVVFEHSKENDTIAAMGDTFKRRQED